MADKTLVDLSHRIDPGMTTYKGLPGPVVCDYWSREASAAHYDDGASFHIARIDMIANTGTYLDSPFHRYASGKDIAELALGQLASLPGLVIRKPFASGLAIDAGDIAGVDVRGRAVLFHTGWDTHWRTDAYQQGHPFLTAMAARALVDGGARLVGIDSHNIDDTTVRTRPVHTLLLGADIPICEHMTNLGALPGDGFTLSAVPPRFSGVGTFPVRAYAEIAG